MKPRLKNLATVALAAAMLIPARTDAKETAEGQHPKPVRKEYSFSLGFNPTEMLVYSTAFYPVKSNGIVNPRRVPLFEAGKRDTIVDAVVSPAGNSLIIVYKHKNKNVGEVWEIAENPEKKNEFNNKKIGVPTAGAYSSDARTLMLATSTGIHNIEPRKFQETGSLEIPFAISDMAVSPNDLYLAVSGGSKAAVYNLESKEIRKEWDFGARVTDMAFNVDNTQLAILTDDGMASIFDTRTMLIKKTVDDLGAGISMDYNFDGKYLAVITDPSQIVLINLLNDEREIFDIDEGFATDIRFIPDSHRHTLMTYTCANAVKARRMEHLAPYYGKLIADQVNERMNEWMKMMPGETMEEYKARVNEQSRSAQMRLFEQEISTDLAGDQLSMQEVSLGKYNRSNGMLQIDFSSMPSIFLPVPETNVAAFTSGSDLSFSDVRYGVLPDDNFEVIYAKVLNKKNGETYTYDNLDRVPLGFMEGDDNVVSLDIIQQQMMEEKKLQEIRQQVIDRSKQQNIISEHTNISVDSRVVPDYDANGNRILNYIVKFTYEVDPEFSAVEDFRPGKYHVEESGAATAMLSIVKEAFEGDFSQYLKDGKKLKINISGTADSSPIIRGIPYDGSFGEIYQEPVRQNGELSSITITDKAMENPQLALLRALGVRKYLQDNVKDLGKMNTDYSYEVNVSQDKGGQYRRITTEFTFVDAF